MDVRGIEVTNQLRSAIRAKLLELGVRYDEELPDYILVMVVNKKSRQQMNEDLHLFLENNTAPFVDWLHDQVLKKLQKVTIAKKKTTREFVPAVVIKQEEERKKRKTATSFLEDQSTTEEAKKLLGKALKQDKQVEKEIVTKSDEQNEAGDSGQKDTKKSLRKIQPDDPPTKTQLASNESENIASKKVTASSEQSSDLNQSISKSNPSHSESENSKSIPEVIDNPDLDINTTLGKRSSASVQEDNLSVSDSKRLKSSVSKPTITSVVSIKNRLGIVSSRKKFDVHQDKEVHKLKHGEEQQLEHSRKNHFSKTRASESNDSPRKSRDSDTKIRGSEKTNDIKTRLGNTRDERPNVNVETKDKTHITEKTTTIKDRLGTSNSTKMLKLSTTNTEEFKEGKRIENKGERGSFKGKNVKYRLGPVKRNFRPIDRRRSFKSSLKNLETEKSDSNTSLSIKDDLDDADQSDTNNVPVKSHIVAVHKPLPEKSSRKRLKSDNKQLSETEDEEFEDCKVPSKVIVTPRPLKPLQPTQKRATQSLLLRAVAEANQSVVMQKNPEPSLVEVKSSPKRSLPSALWSVGQNLSVHLDSQKRFVMEKIQVELTTVKTNDTKFNDSHEVTDEHIGVVRSLFQQSNNDQKFLVTLNGYNNNLSKEKSSDDSEENLEVKEKESDEQDFFTDNSNPYQQTEPDSIASQETNTEEDDNEDNDSSTSKQSDNDEKQNADNIDVVIEIPKKTRKRSPIIYDRSQSPPKLSITTLSKPSVTNYTEKKCNNPEGLSVIINDQSEEKCRYWPNCTLGNNCAYYHPSIPCSAFPACRFGENCIYLHPKCKFGLECTKVGCIFLHPSEKCKYHPYCTKPACSYSHPSVKTSQPTSGPNRRAKFTWTRRN